MSQQFPTVQEVYDLQRDLADFAEFINTTDVKDITTRLGKVMPSLKKIVDEVRRSNSAYSFATLSALQSAGTPQTISGDDDTTVDIMCRVWNDPIDENNGLYGWEPVSGTWVKSQFDTVRAEDVVTKTALAAWYPDTTAGLAYDDNDVIWGICDAANRVALGVTARGETVGYLNGYIDTIEATLRQAIDENQLNIGKARVTRANPLALGQAGAYDDNDVVWGVVDGDNKVALGITRSGETIGYLRQQLDAFYDEYTQRNAAADSFATTSRHRIDALRVDMADLSAIVKGLPYEQNDVVWGITDGAGQIAIGITQRGEQVGFLANRVQANQEETTARLDSNENLATDNQTRSKRNAVALDERGAFSRGMPYSDEDIVWGIVDSTNALVLGVTRQGELVGYYSAQLSGLDGRVIALESAMATLQGASLTPDDAAPAIYTERVGTYQQIMALEGDTVSALTPDEFDAYHPSIHRNSYLKFAAAIDGPLRQWRQTLDGLNRVRAQQQVIQHVLIIGQSNAIPKFVTGTTQPLTTGVLDPGAALQFVGDTANGHNHLWPNYLQGWTTAEHDDPIVEAELAHFVDIAPNVAESHAYGIYETYSQGQHVMVFSGHGQGGAAYRYLEKGTDAYANSLACVSRAKALASALGLRYEVLALVCEHGESDSQNANYANDLLQWLTDYNADITAITGQTTAIPMLLSQQQSWPYGGTQNTSASVLGQLAFHISQPLGRLVGPKYFLPHDNGGTGNGLANDGDGIHLSAYGIRTLSEYYAKALAAGAGWEPLRPDTIVFDGVSVITVSFVGRVGPLQWQVYDAVTAPLGVADPGHYGFELHDADGAAITQVALSNDATQVHITVDRVLPPTARLAYAYSAPSLPANAGPLTGPRGCLSDSDPTPPSARLQTHRQTARGMSASMAASPLVNWCVTFIDAISV